jgi:hypothetical protein
MVNALLAVTHVALMGARTCNRRPLPTKLTLNASASVQGQAHRMDGRKEHNALHTLLRPRGSMPFYQRF